MIFFIELVFIGVMLNSTKVKPSYNGEDFLLGPKCYFLKSTLKPSKTIHTLSHTIHGYIPIWVQCHGNQLSSSVPL